MNSSLTELFSNIAVAIREKTGTSDRIVADAFPNAIMSIKTKYDNMDANHVLENIIYRNFSIVEHSTISTIGSYAFANSEQLISASFPKCETISERAFVECSMLQSIYAPICSIIGMAAFTSCYSLSSVYIPELNYVNYWMFAYCSSLTKVNFPKCSFVDTEGFYRCRGLKLAYLPACTFLSYGAFGSCSNLSAVYLGASTVCSLSTRATNVFESTPYNKVSSYFSGTPYIYVPLSLIMSYKTDSNWSVYSSYFSAIENAPNPI